MKAEERKEQEKIAPKEHAEDIRKEEQAKQNVEHENDKPDTPDLMSGSDGGAAGDGGAA